MNAPDGRPEKIVTFSQLSLTFTYTSHNSLVLKLMDYIGRHAITSDPFYTEWYFFKTKDQKTIPEELANGVSSAAC